MVIGMEIEIAMGWKGEGAFGNGAMNVTGDNL